MAVFVYLLCPKISSYVRKFRRHPRAVATLGEGSEPRHHRAHRVPSKVSECKPSKPPRLPLSEEIPLSMWQDFQRWDTTSSSTLSYSLPRPLPWLVASHS